MMVSERTLSEASPTAAQSGAAISFGEFHLVPATRPLTKHGTPVRLGARAIDILTTLIQQAGRVEGRAELPAPLVTIIGRDEVISEIATQLTRKRLVTVTGVGGLGKTAVGVPGSVSTRFHAPMRRV